MLSNVVLWKVVSIYYYDLFLKCFNSMYLNKHFRVLYLFKENLLVVIVIEQLQLLAQFQLICNPLHGILKVCVGYKLEMLSNNFTYEKPDLCVSCSERWCKLNPPWRSCGPWDRSSSYWLFIPLLLTVSVPCGLSHSVAQCWLKKQNRVCMGTSMRYGMNVWEEWKEERKYCFKGDNAF